MMGCRRWHESDVRMRKRQEGVVGNRIRAARLSLWMRLLFHQTCDRRKGACNPITYAITKFGVQGSVLQFEVIG